MQAMYLLRTIKITGNTFPLLKSDFVEMAPRNSVAAVFYHICPAYSSRGIVSLCLVLHMVIRFLWLWTSNQSKLQHWLCSNDTLCLHKGYEVLISHKKRENYITVETECWQNGTTEQRRGDSHRSLSSSSPIALTLLPHSSHGMLSSSKQSLQAPAQHKAACGGCKPRSSGSADTSWVLWLFTMLMLSTHPAGIRLLSLAIINILS